MDQQLMQESLLNRLGYHRANLKQLEGSYEKERSLQFHYDRQWKSLYDNLHSMANFCITQVQEANGSLLLL